MKIVLAITKSNFGGAQRYVFDLATSFKEHGDDVVVVCGGEGALTKKLTEHHIRVVSIPSLGRDVSLREDIEAMRNLARIIRTEKPDILHINSAKIGGLGSLLGRILFVPGVVFTAHGWAFNEARPFWQRAIIHAASLTTVLLAHKTIFVSNETKRQLGFKWLVSGKSLVIHNGRKTPDFLSREDARHALTRINPGLDCDPSTLWTLSIGELHPVKSHDLMIEAISQVIARHENIQHVIIGDGELRDELTELIRNKKLEDRVFLLGHINEAANYLKAADIFVLPSRSEALAYVAIEAAAAGLPIIASDVGGIPEVIENQKSGALVHAGRADEFAHAIIHLIETPKESASLASEALLRSKHFTLDRMVNDTKDLYKSIVG